MGFAGSIEIQMLCWSIVLGLVQIVLAASTATFQRGLAYNVSSRDMPPPPVGPVAARLARASRNFLETFPFFAAAVLVIATLGRHSDLSGIGAQLYFWARLVYVLAYAAGIAYLRTLVWAVSLVGLVLVLIAACAGG
ncbi:MAG TPA: MAPEG family protein [Rhizomicrobium sp.]